MSEVEISSEDSDGRPVHYCYSRNQDDPESWPKSPVPFKGPFQSPVDIDVGETQPIELQPLKWFNYEIPPKRMKITNNGHTVVLSGKWQKIRPYISHGPLSTNYVFSQLHFHWGLTDDEGSEHTVNGESFPLEMHVVHFKSSYKTQEVAVKEKDGLVVISFLFKLLPKPAPEVQHLVDSLQHIRNPKTSVDVVAPFPLSCLFNSFEEHYYFYWGSLTTPPCTQLILWLTSQTYLGISASQLAEFRTLISSHGGPLVRNFRPVQPLNDRKLFNVTLESEKPKEEETLPVLAGTQNIQVVQNVHDVRYGKVAPKFDDKTSSSASAGKSETKDSPLQDIFDKETESDCNENDTWKLRKITIMLRPMGAQGKEQFQNVASQDNESPTRAKRILLNPYEASQIEFVIPKVADMPSQLYIKHSDKPEKAETSETKPTKVPKSPSIPKEDASLRKTVGVHQTNTQPSKDATESDNKVCKLKPNEPILKHTPFKSSVLVSRAEVDIPKTLSSRPEMKNIHDDLTENFIDVQESSKRSRSSERKRSGSRIQQQDIKSPNKTNQYPVLPTTRKSGVSATTHRVSKVPPDSRTSGEKSIMEAQIRHMEMQDLKMAQRAAAAVKETKSSVAESLNYAESPNVAQKLQNINASQGKIERSLDAVGCNTEKQDKDKEALEQLIASAKNSQLYDKLQKPFDDNSEDPSYPVEQIVKNTKTNPSFLRRSYKSKEDIAFQGTEILNPQHKDNYSEDQKTDKTSKSTDNPVDRPDSVRLSGAPQLLQEAGTKVVPIETVFNKAEEENTSNETTCKIEAQTAHTSNELELTTPRKSDTTEANKTKGESFEGINKYHYNKYQQTGILPPQTGQDKFSHPQTKPSEKLYTAKPKRFSSIHRDSNDENTSCNVKSKKRDNKPTEKHDTSKKDRHVPKEETEAQEATKADVKKKSTDFLSDYYVNVVVSNKHGITKSEVIIGSDGKEPIVIHSGEHEPAVVHEKHHTRRSVEEPKELASKKDQKKEPEENPTEENQPGTSEKHHQRHSNSHNKGKRSKGSREHTTTNVDDSSSAAPEYPSTNTFEPQERHRKHEKVDPISNEPSLIACINATDLQLGGVDSRGRTRKKSSELYVHGIQR